MLIFRMYIEVPPLSQVADWERSLGAQLFGFEGVRGTPETKLLQFEAVGFRFRRLWTLEFDFGALDC